MEEIRNNIKDIKYKFNNLTINNKNETKIFENGKYIGELKNELRKGE